ncbi:FtsQ-type POTRA domain-containing protein [Streptomyces xinghaiensis]|uniref:cell division protein FtsQ/DivIB n=1 Tax=Streptomyces xinghaiensis TaxID=1038928 RepID=UPI0002FCB6C7|nr:FtsQ-type POTRA domain-containing protein [Streptomyces sp. SID5475]
MAGQTTARRGGNGLSPSGPSPEPAGRERPRRWRPRGDRLVFWALGLALSAAGVFWFLYGSPWVRVERVTVDGTGVLTPEQVRRAAAVPLGAPLVSVDTDAVAARLREKLPRVDSVEVVRSWPHEVGLKVTERKPAVLIEKGGKFIEVDGEGVLFATVSQPPKGVPLLEMDAARSPSLRRFGAERLRREAAGVAAGLPAPIHRETRALVVRSYDSVTLELTGGRTVVWGSPERSEQKAGTLLALLKSARGADHFDVSSPSAPAVSGS